MWEALSADPVTGLTCALVLAVAAVNGWTDAPNAIAGAVATGALPFRRAAALAALCDLAGLFLALAISPAVTKVLFSIASFGGEPRAARAALCAGLCAVAVWATAAWRFGIPTSESHGLAAAVAGAAMALPGGCVRPGPWLSILLGLGLSVGLGWLGGRLGRAALEALRPSAALCRRGQVLAAAAMALLHGAQDGQKFLGILLLGLSLSPAGGAFPRGALALACALAMAAGTALGGRRIIETVGRDMVRLDAAGGLAADLGGGACLLLCTLLGLPVSTTHAKTAALLGAGRQADGRVAGGIALTWLCTFPGCGLLGFFLTKLFLFFP